MTDAWGSLHIEVVDGEIVVTAPFLPGCCPTSVIGGKADMAQTCQYVRQ